MIYKVPSPEGSEVVKERLEKRLPSSEGSEYFHARDSRDSEQKNTIVKNIPPF